MTPADVSSLLQSAGAHHAAGRFDDARAAYETVLSLDPHNAMAMHHLGILAAQQNQFDVAADWMTRSIDAEPSNPKFINNLAALYTNIGMALCTSHDLDRAIESFKKAISLKPDSAQAMNALGTVHQKKGDYTAALELFRKADSLCPNWPIPKQNIAVAFRESGKLDEAIAAADAALQLEVGHAETHLNKSCAMLLSGKMEAESWAEYSWRSRCKGFHREMPMPAWDGSDPRGQTILLHGEQGMGDEIQFIRYAELVAQLGATVFVECTPPLHKLFSTIPSISKVIPRGQPIPHATFHAPLLDLPRLLGTTLSTIPAIVPYLKVDPDFSRHWKDQLAATTKIKVGLAWAGNPSHATDYARSIQLNQLAPLSRAKNIQFFTLQKGPASDQLLNAPGELALIDWTKDLTDFSQTAALIANLDLVISVDTSVAHLAGALAKPVWILLPYAPDWRWMLHRDDSPWYPTMRLFRQSTPNNWAEVIDRVANELANFSPHL